MEPWRLRRLVAAWHEENEQVLPTVEMSADQIVLDWGHVRWSCRVDDVNFECELNIDGSVENYLYDDREDFVGFMRGLYACEI